MKVQVVSDIYEIVASYLYETRCLSFILQHAGEIFRSLQTES